MSCSRPGWLPPTLCACYMYIFKFDYTLGGEMDVAEFLDNFLRTLCSMQVQRNQSKVPTTRTNRAGRYSCITSSQ
jgi:hypothetical protein